MQKETLWILVSDASQARLYTTNDRGQTLALLKEFVHAASRAKAADLVSDQPGRLQQSGRLGVSGIPGKGSRSRAETANPKEIAWREFASILSAILEQGLKNMEYQKLILIASPHFLGLMRQKISEQVTKRMLLSVDKDYVHLPLEELRLKLKELI